MFETLCSDILEIEAELLWEDVAIDFHWDVMFLVMDIIGEWDKFFIVILNNYRIILFYKG
jgi:hypothetical protein